MTRILVVEDDPAMSVALRDGFEFEKHTVAMAADGEEALRAASGHDVIILDVMLPSRDGFEVCRRLRENGVNTPVLMLTARNELNNKVQGFKAGSDDYLTKPFETPELEARIEALLRRASRGARNQLKSYDFDGIHVDFARSELTKNGKSTALGEREARLLRYLIERKGAILSRDELLQEVWGYKSIPLTRTVDVHIAWLRQKIEDDPKNPRHIVTVHGQGYRFGR